MIKLTAAIIKKVNSVNDILRYLHYIYINIYNSCVYINMNLYM